jgi:prepilin-type N-terminal cleavage/methylation domain-containing protein
MKRLNKQSGFTLIELLITLVIIGIAVALIASSFALGLKSWSGTSQKIKVHQQIRVCLDIMSSRIRNAFISNLNRNLAFKGDRYSLSFITTSATTSGLTNVQFGMKEEEKLLWMEELGEEEKTFLSKGIELIEFMYYDPKDGQWKESWDSIELRRLPAAVKISITLYDDKITIPEIVTMIPCGMEHIKGQEGEK